MHRLRWIFSSLGEPSAGLPELFALAREHRLAGVELRCLRGGLDLVPALRAEFGRPAALADFLRREASCIHIFDTSAALLPPGPGGDEAFFAELEAFVPWAEAAGAPWLRVFDGATPGHDGPGLEPAAAARAAARLSHWRYLRARGGWACDLLVETHDALCPPAARREFLAGPGAGTGLLWDAHHTWKMGGEDPLLTWICDAPHIRHIHLKDSVSRPGPRHPYTYVLPGEGEFPLRPLLQRLAADAYPGLLCLEWERHWHPDLPPLTDALQALRRHGFLPAAKGSVPES